MFFFAIKIISVNFKTFSGFYEPQFGWQSKIQIQVAQVVGFFFIINNFVSKITAKIIRGIYFQQKVNHEQKVWWFKVALFFMKHGIFHINYLIYFSIDNPLNKTSSQNVNFSRELLFFRTTNNMKHILFKN